MGGAGDKRYDSQTVSTSCQDYTVGYSFRGCFRTKSLCLRNSTTEYCRSSAPGCSGSISSLCHLICLPCETLSTASESISKGSREWDPGSFDAVETSLQNTELSLAHDTFASSDVF